MSVRLKTFHHFLEEYPEYNPEVDTLDGVVDRMNDELNDLEDGIRNLNMTPQQSFEAVAIMINKSRLYVSAMAQEETIAKVLLAMVIIIHMDKYLIIRLILPLFLL